MIRPFVAVFLWTSTGDFDEIRVDEAIAEPGRPPGNTRTVDDGLVATRLAELGLYVLEPIEVAPFSTLHDGIEFGFIPQAFDGMVSVNLMPGDSIAYYEPWDGFEYDT